MSEGVDHIENYKKASVPHETYEDAKANLEKFFGGLYDLRNECVIPDVSCVMKYKWFDDAGEEQDATAAIYIGDSRNEIFALVQALAAAYVKVDKDGYIDIYKLLRKVIAAARKERGEQ